jgi:alcohol dehydrogenase
VDGPRRGARRVVDLPPVAAGEILLRVEACALSATDGEQWAGHLPAPWPYVPGSEVVGVVEATGAGAADRLGVAPGDRVVVAPRRWCGRCDPCRARRIRRCARFGATPAVGQEPLRPGRPPFGGMAHHLVLGDGVHLTPVPASMDPVLAAATNAVAEAYRWMTGPGAVRRGDVVAILGPGLRGLAAAAMATDAGAAVVAVIGRGPGDAGRLALAPSFGAHLAVDGAVTDPVAALESHAGRRADVVLDAT